MGIRLTVDPLTLTQLVLVRIQDPSQFFKDQYLNIFYTGGSGGFIFLHILMSTNQYSFSVNTMTIDNYRSLKFISKKQWSVLGKNWKEHEVWPTNELTLESNSPKEKILFVCNDFDKWIEYKNHKKVIIYLDLRSQIRFCHYKNCGMFFNISNCSKRFNKAKNLLKSNKKYTKLTEKALDFADTRIRLQDLINQPHETLENNFSISPNKDTIDLINHWKSLHPPKLLQKCGFNLDDISY